MWTCIWVKTASGSNDAWHLWGFGMPKQKDIPSFVFICFNLCQSYPLVNIQKAIENGDLWWIYPFKMVIFRYVNVYQRVLEPGQVYPKSLWIRSQDSMHPVAYYLQRAADGRGKKSKSEMKDTTSTQLQIKKTGQFLNSVEASEGFWGCFCAPWRLPTGHATAGFIKLWCLADSRSGVNVLASFVQGREKSFEEKNGFCVAMLGGEMMNHREDDIGHCINYKSINH